MQTISLHSKVSDDGMLRLEVPAPIGARGEHVEVLVVMQFVPSPSLIPLSELAGAIDDDTFIEPAELPFEIRESVS